MIFLVWKYYKIYMRENLKRIYHNRESGQMLLFVMVILLLLLIIVLAIVVNVKVDLKETQMEREYERGYSIAEDVLFDISSDGYDDSEYDDYSGAFCPSDDECIGNVWKCSEKAGLGDGESAVIVKRCEHHGIIDMTIEKDQTLEVDLRGATGDLNLSWQGAPAMSIMLVCKSAAGNYTNVRASVCRTGDGNCAMSGVSGFISLAQAVNPTVSNDAPLNMDDGCLGGYTPELLRLRAIGGQATSVTLTGDNLPAQMEEVRVQSFTEGIQDAEGLSAPEVVTFSMIRKRLPSIFDYVLFVADGSVSK